MKVAVVHEMLIKLGGAENVVDDILGIFPDADLYTLIYDEDKVGKLFPASRVKGVANMTQKIYSWTKRQRLCLPFMSRAIESLDLSDYDLVIASSSGFAHGCITKPETCFVVYYHSPARYLWDYTNEYQRDIGFGYGIKKFLLNKFFLGARQWDYLAGQRHDVAVGASKQVQSRIAKYYRRDSELVYPGVYVDEFTVGEAPLKERDYYVITSALTEFKKVEVAIEAFNVLGYPLYILGDGAHRKYLESIAKPNIKFVGYSNRKTINEYYQNARGFIMAGRDDYGIAPIEAMAAGVPVFALNQGGLVETNIAGLSGDFFNNPKGSDFIEKFEKFHNDISEGKYDRIKIRNHALEFSKDRFVSEFKEMLSKYI